MTEYTPEHEKELHLIAVRRDTAGYQHVQPVMDERASGASSWPWNRGLAVLRRHPPGRPRRGHDAGDRHRGRRAVRPAAASRGHPDRAGRRVHRQPERPARPTCSPI
ncbi:hypothetical protein NKH18_25750 [Streptomyces sp. M10(2022)]